MANLAVNKTDTNFRPASLTSCQFNLYSPNSSKREDVANYIAAKYRQVHEAYLHDFLPILVQIKRDQQPLAAFGLQPGHYRPLFLEQYLDRPIEQHVAQIAGQPIDRCALMEIGNLVITRNIYGPLLLVTLTSALAQAGYEWMVFTATNQVARLLAGMGFDPHYLVTADPDRLGSAKANWGTYYKNNPRVMVGNISSASELISCSPRLLAMAEQYQDDINQIARSLVDYRRISGE